MKRLFLLFTLFILSDCGAQNSSADLDKRLTEMGKKYVARDYENAYKLAKGILQKDDKNLMALNCLMNSAFELGKTKEAVEATTKSISLIDVSTLFPYLAEHGQYRQFLREAYNLRAWIQYLEAKSNKDFQKALEDINTGLSITSPIDNDLNMHAYIDTKVRILLKLGRQNEAYSLVEKAIRKNPDMSDLQDIKRSEEYKKYQQEFHQSGWGKYMKGTSSETAMEALTRYEAFIKLYEKDTEQELPFQHVKWTKDKFKLSDLKEVEKRLNIILPADYVKFATTYGNFSILDGYELLTPKEITRLSDALKKEWEINLNKECTPKQRENLDNLICFAYGEEDQQEVWYFVFSYKTRNSDTGFMDVLPYNQDDWEALTETPKNVYTDKRGSFDAHISNLVNDLIKEVIEQ